MKLNALIPASPMCDLVEIENGTVVTDSLKIAEVFGKEHAHVMRDIRQKVLPNISEEFNQSNFGLVDYKDSKGEYRPMYRMTRDGFTMVVMGYTGPKAMQFKEMYINRFNELEAALHGTRPTTDDLIDQAATKITTKLFPQFVKTVTATLSKDIVERIRSLPQGEQLLQLPEPVQQPTPPKPKRTYITLYVVLTWDEKDGVQIYKTKDRAKYMDLLKDIIAQHKQYTVEHIRTVSYK